jgi:hypothetical protein
MVRETWKVKDGKDNQAKAKVAALLVAVEKETRKRRLPMTFSKQLRRVVEIMRKKISLPL